MVKLHEFSCQFMFSSLSTNMHISHHLTGFDDWRFLNQCIFKPSLTLVAYLECHIFLLDLDVSYALE